VYFCKESKIILVGGVSMGKDQHVTPHPGG